MKTGVLVTAGKFHNTFWLGIGYLGRMVSAQGYIRDGLGILKFQAFNRILLPRKLRVPGVFYRARVTEHIMTGNNLGDILFPLGRGQRELLIGNKYAGRRSWVKTTMQNQTPYRFRLARGPIFSVNVSIGHASRKVVPHF